MENSTIEITKVLNEVKTFLIGRVGTNQIRLNILSPKSSKLKIIAHTDGFDSEELKITLSMGQGCSGIAWNSKKPSISDLTKDVHWLAAEEGARVKRGLKIVLGIPLFDPDLVDIHKVIGVLSIDSTESIYAALNDSISVLMPYATTLAVLIKKSGL